jgi:hypothetical protein
MSYKNYDGKLIETVSYTSNKYVVYLHINANTREVFYVGSGNNKRPFDFSRSDAWHKYVSVNQFEIVIYDSNLDKTKARELESDLINLYRITGNLVNRTHRIKKLPKEKRLHKREKMMFDFLLKSKKHYPHYTRISLIDYNKTRFDLSVVRGYCSSHHEEFEKMVEFYFINPPCYKCLMMNIKNNRNG